MLQVDRLPLWDILQKKADDDLRGRIRKLIEDAAAILDRVLETFPTYTLHNSTHAENVVRIMADLLGPWRERLTGLEAAFLLLSAFYHDIGMVFAEAERQCLTEEPEWKQFLGKHPEAYLAMKSHSDLPADIAEWYCRWRHADRVFVYLGQIPDSQLRWGHVLIREELGELCRSHNLDTAELLMNKHLRTDFLANADLRFCAIILRLADILDFDRSRSPEPVYQYLGIAQRQTPRISASDVEWRKHLCSEGFIFPTERQFNYILDFVAGPDEPAVEHDLRQFLDVIEDEMTRCKALVESCQTRWRDFPLPASINRSNIHSNGYRFGEYRFILDQKQILDLLMGENLYVDPYVFVRELIQNAIDTSRHRQYLEIARGNTRFQAQPIVVREWRDIERRHWVRIDDYGMGMDEEIVKDHLLRVGSSYYRTARFRAEVLQAREKGAPDFVPISRFGIGLLSCFIAADRVEISTCRAGRSGEPQIPIRLSLHGLHSFYTLQNPPLLPHAMPAPREGEHAYRVEPGTSIAVRLDPTKERQALSLSFRLKKHALCPPVPVKFEGRNIGLDPRILDTPLCEARKLIITNKDMVRIEEFLEGFKFSGPLELNLIPLNLSKHSPTPEVKGQLAVAVFPVTEEWRRVEEWLKMREISLADPSISYDDSTGLGLTIAASGPGRNDALIIRIADLFTPTETPIIAALNPKGSSTVVWVAHNGMAVPPVKQNQWFHSQKELIIDLGQPLWQTGIISLSDSLRPDVSVSRDELRGISWRAQSAAGLALHRALTDQKMLIYNRAIRPFGDFRQDLLLGDFLEDELLSGDGPWAQERVIPTEVGIFSLVEIKKILESDLNAHVALRLKKRSFLSDVANCCAWVLVQVGLNIRLDVRSSEIVAVAGRANPVTEGHNFFRPLAFIPFESSDKLFYVPPLREPISPLAVFINQDHPLPRWLLMHAPLLARRYPALLAEFRSALDASNPKLLSKLLGRARQLELELRPPGDIQLTKSSFF